jgi:dihydrolipoamide dehydrogenase
MEKIFDVVVIGAGPGGYVAAIKCAQLGMRVACVDANESLGGTCLNVGCIPSKALLQSSHKFHETLHNLEQHGISAKSVSLDLKKMMERKDKVVSDLTGGIKFLFKKNKVTSFTGHAQFVSENAVDIIHQGVVQRIEAKNFIIATGSSVTTIPHIPIDEKMIVSSTGALALESVPKTLIVIGGGYIGLEMASIWSRLGSKVSVVEFSDRIVPAMDEAVSSELQVILEKQGIQFYLGHKVTKVDKNGAEVIPTFENKEGKTFEHKASLVLVSVGRVPNTEGLNLEAVGIELNARGFIPVNEKFETKKSNIFAIGDVIGGMMLAHKAEDEGCAVAEILAGQHSHVNYDAIPAVIYTHPEVASVGKTEETLKENGVSYKAFKFPMSVNGRAKANGETEGFVKILTHLETDEVLGVHIIAADAGNMIAEATLAMEYKASAEDIARTCHAHPTTAEAFKEAALGAWFKTINA